ncbi:MAG: 2-dehydropantoate 2-reductase [Dehalococcoidia bacterium]|nr:2-dehydropantoate 2-reductase [Dehalococcoidia bacterium]MCB9486849.1 2-dehydropantoate 2-reductase [Thermoflexaceae bacterium]
MASIAIIGTGAVGGYYGARLAKAGHDVRFLARSDYRAISESGLDIRSHEGDFQLRPASVFRSAAEIGVVDWVICALKTTSLDQAPALIAPCAGPATRVLALMNGLGIEERLAAYFDRRRIFGAMAFVCINRTGPGVIHHLKYGRLSIGHLDDDPAETTALAELLRGANLDVVTAPNLRWARWDKLCWNIPFNGLSVAAGGIGTEAITGDDLLRGTAERAMREVVSLGNADLAAAGSPDRLETAEVVARMFSLTDTMGNYHTSMALDYAQARPLEVETILGEPSRRAAALGVHVPTIDALYTLVHAADLRRRSIIPSVGDGNGGQ